MAHHLGLIITAGALVGVVAIFGFVMLMIRVAKARMVAQVQALGHEGLVKDTGLRTGTIRLTNYNGPGMRTGVSVNRGPMHLVLTRASFGLPYSRHLPRVPVNELHRYSVTTSGGELVVASSNPWNATGNVEIRIPVDDPEAWVQALRDAGAIAG